MPPLRDDAADAARLRWLLNGHGYFLEEEMLCGHGPGEEDEARTRIDEAMRLEAETGPEGPVAHRPVG